LPINVGSE